jgi:Tfp pilus assembly protein PilO
MKIRALGALKTVEIALHAAAFGGLATLIAVATWLFLLPIVAQRTACELEIAAEADLVGRALEIMEQKRLTDGELAAAGAELNALQQRIPSTPNEAEFLASICELAQRADLGIADYRPGPIEARDSHRELEVKLTAGGEYESLCRFLAELPELPRLSRLTQLKIQAEATETLTAQMTFRIYFSLPAETQTAQKEEQHGR